MIKCFDILLTILWPACSGKTVERWNNWVTHFQINKHFITDCNELVQHVVFVIFYVRYSEVAPDTFMLTTQSFSGVFYDNKMCIIYQVPLSCVDTRLYFLLSWVWPVTYRRIGHTGLWDHVVEVCDSDVWQRLCSGTQLKCTDMSMGQLIFLLLFWVKNYRNDKIVQYIM